jgi:hypothetical protein
VRRYLSLFAVLLSIRSFGQTQTSSKPEPSKPTPDVLIFANGDQLTGTLERVAAGNIVFKSDMAGEVTVSVEKVKELRSGAQFALLRKGEKVGKGRVLAPEGTVEIVGGTVTVTPVADAAVTLPAKDLAYLVEKAAFDKQVNHKTKWYEAWNGQASGGATLVRSTTSETTLTAGLNLLPGVPWMAARNRTTLDVNESYGKNTSPGAIPQTVPKPTPDVTTLSSIFHADAERDEYISPRFYVLADTSFDHNYAQGLQLQQVYGGGVGWTAIQTPKQQLDLKVDVHYEQQKHITTYATINGVLVPTALTTNLIGSTFFESYRRDLPKKLVFTEVATVLPAFNDSSAYSANGTATLAIPVFKRLSAMISTTDNFLNDPAVGYKKNSYQFVTGVTYLLR